MPLKLLSTEDLVQLLRDEVERAGGQSAWARNEHVNRPHLNKVLAGRKAITPALLKKLKVKTVYIRDNLIALALLWQILRDNRRHGIPKSVFR